MILIVILLMAIAAGVLGPQVQYAGREMTWP